MRTFKSAVLSLVFVTQIWSSTPLPYEEENPLLQPEEDNLGINPFVLLTVPKSGSHLLMKALHLLTGGVSLWHTRFPSLYYVPPSEGFLYTHLCTSPELEDDYAYLPLLKKIINIRDLRDVCVSIIRQIEKSPWPGLSGEQRDAFLQLSSDEKLLFVINFEYQVDEVASYAPNSLQVSVSHVAAQATRYAYDPNNLVCKYEDLVGPEGGGSKEAQLQDLRRIAGFLGVAMDDAELEVIASRLYGDSYDPFGKGVFENFSSTFSRGKVGGWREFFKEEHKLAFKEKLGHSLIALGYEEDNNW